MPPLPPLSALKQSGNTRATCRGVVDQAIADPVVRKRTKSMCLTCSVDLASLGVRGNVLDTKFGPRYDVKKPLVLTRIRQDVSAEKGVAAMISPPRQHTSCSSKIISASASIAYLLHRDRMLWIVEHPCDSWLWDVPKLQTLAVQLRTVWALADFCILGSPCTKRTLFLVGNVDSRDQHRVARNTVLGQADVAVCLEKKNFIQKLPPHVQGVVLHVTTPALSVCLSRSPWFSP